MPVKKQSPSEVNYRKLKAYLMYPEEMEAAAVQLYKVFDMQKTGFFNKQDLQEFLGFLL